MPPHESLSSTIPLEEAYGELYEQIKWSGAVSLVAIAAIFAITFTLANRAVSELEHKELLEQ